ncbi:MAG: phosphatase PAP2 family protein [Nanoarchaeota archaeon]
MRKLILFVSLFLVFIVSFLIDKPISLFFSSLRTQSLNSIMLFLSKIGNFYSALIILIVVLISFELSKKDKKYIPTIFFSLLVSSLLVYLLKNIFQRQRPYETFPIQGLEQKSDFSFPSGHANAVFSLVPFMNIHFKKLKWFWLVFSILVAISRIYLGSHYLSDVIFSIITGLGFSYFFISLERKFKLSRIFIKK